MTRQPVAVLGMVLRADVLGEAIEHTMAGVHGNWPLIYLSPRGRRMDQRMMQNLARCDGMTLLCGRFEGVDERVLEHYGVQEVSLGDFVMTGGEIAAQALIDATVRLIPGVLGNQASTEEESFSSGLLEHPQYTRPADWKGRPIPEVLMSGHHGRIAEWRHKNGRRYHPRSTSRHLGRVCKIQARKTGLKDRDVAGMPHKISLSVCHLKLRTPQSIQFLGP